MTTPDPTPVDTAAPSADKILSFLRAMGAHLDEAFVGYEQADGMPNRYTQAADEIERLRSLVKLAGEHEHEWQPDEDGRCEFCGNERVHDLHPLLVSALWRDTVPATGTLYMEAQVPALKEGEYLTIFRTPNPPSAEEAGQ